MVIFPFNYFIIFHFIQTFSRSVEVVLKLLRNLRVTNELHHVLITTVLIITKQAR